MTAIKICGLRSEQEISWANQLRLEYIGLVFAPSSRRIAPEQAQIITRKLSPRIKKVGVFVNCPREELHAVIRFCALDVVQLHGDESPDYCRAVDIPVWKAIRVKNPGSLAVLNDYQVEAFVLDAYHPDHRGGSGRNFDWSLLNSDLRNNHRIILAGGLNPANVAEALNQVHPYAVDVSSGVEMNGRKNRSKMTSLVKKVREYDATGK